MKIILTVFVFFYLILPVVAQEEEQLERLSGYIYSPDSLVIENAYLINFNTLRAYATDENGFFDIEVMKGDSFKIHHVAYASFTVSHHTFTTNDTIFLDFEINEIGGIEVNDYKIHEANFKTNNSNIQKEIDVLTKVNYKNEKTENPYTTNQYTNTTGASISDIIELFKKKE